MVAVSLQLALPCVLSQPEQRHGRHRPRGGFGCLADTNSTAPRSTAGTRDVDAQTGMGCAGRWLLGRHEHGDTLAALSGPLAPTLAGLGHECDVDRLAPALVLNGAFLLDEAPLPIA
ncbi:hypothetical protein CAE01nite_20490 [Cellulomonas aerilata]|uniref:Uncharacterized protein n=1 Tax=Cellulomonas aerilata TaxID=515326 RepID=A0A512DCX5_9CELL|nr:hypothetical protein CAE01nite_20490 [Cellulomonas aerilata]